MFLPPIGAWFATCSKFAKTATFGTGNLGELWVGCKASSVSVATTFGTDFSVKVLPMPKNVGSGSFLTTGLCPRYDAILSFCNFSPFIASASVA